MQQIAGEKNLTRHIINITINVAADIFWLFWHGADVVFFVFLALTAFWVVRAVLAMRKSISVDQYGVTVNGEELSYDRIASAYAKQSWLYGAASKPNLILCTIDGKKMRFEVKNSEVLAQAILQIMQSKAINAAQF